MADDDNDIIQFSVGDKVTAEITNQNNLLLKQWALDNSASEDYIDEKMAELSETYSSQIDGINSQISSVNNQITSLQSALNNKGYVTAKGKELGIGTTQMTTYGLPQDGKKYLVWFVAKLSEKSDAQLTVSSNLFTTDRLVYKLDGDSGRSSQGVAFGVIPVSSNGWIKFTGKKDYLALIGYCRL